MRMRVQLVSSFIAGGVVAGGLALVSGMGPIDPPAGPVAPSGPSLADIQSSIDNLDLGGGPGGEVMMLGSISPADSLLASALELPTFMQVPGADGESTNANHQNWIEVVNFEHGVERDGQTDLGRVRVAADWDKAMPKLLDFAAMGQQIMGDVVIEMDQVGPSHQPVLNVKLTNAKIVSATPIYASRLVVVEFEFEKLRLDQTIYRPDGSPDSVETFCYDVLNQTGC